MILPEFAVWLEGFYVLGVVGMACNPNATDDRAML